jgi:carbonic anhydrase/acetyltransferase-like protein (isoleucine patch superfamily)
MMRRHGHYFAWDQAVIIGEVTIGEDSSFWPGAVARGDVGPITVGARVSVQDGAVLHCKFQSPLEIGDEVVIGHQATVHCRRVGHGCLIGIGAAVLDDAELGDYCLIAAGAVIRPGTVVPARTLMAGVPAKPIRLITEAEFDYQRSVAARYVQLARDHVAGRFQRHNAG